MTRLVLILLALAACATEGSAIPFHEGASIDDPPPSVGIGLLLQDPADRARYDAFTRNVLAHAPDRFRLEREGTVQEVAYDGTGFDYTAEGPGGSDRQRCLSLDGARLSACKPALAPPPSDP